MISYFFATWFRLANHHPVAFNSVTGGSLCASSDALAQYLELENDNVSQQGQTTTAAHHQHHTDDDDLSFRLRRVASATLIGAVFGGWGYPSAYARLDSLWKGTHFLAIVQKSIVEIFTVGIFVNSISMSSRGLLVGRDKEDVVNHVATEMPVVTVQDAKVWLPYNMIAFGLIPVTIRPTTTLMMEAGWQTYISLMSNNYSKATVAESSKTITTTTAAEHRAPLVASFQPGGKLIVTSTTGR